MYPQIRLHILLFSCWVVPYFLMYSLKLLVDVPITFCQVRINLNKVLKSSAIDSA